MEKSQKSRQWRRAGREHYGFSVIETVLSLSHLIAASSNKRLLASTLWKSTNKKFKLKIKLIHRNINNYLRRAGVYFLVFAKIFSLSSKKKLCSLPLQARISTVLAVSMFAWRLLQKRTFPGVLGMKVFVYRKAHVHVNKVLAWNAKSTPRWLHKSSHTAIEFQYAFRELERGWQLLRSGIVGFFKRWMHILSDFVMETSETPLLACNKYSGEHETNPTLQRFMQNPSSSIF